MTTMARPGVPVGGFKTVGQIVGTNALRIHRSQSALAVAVELLTTHTPGCACNRRCRPVYRVYQ
jgi:hypothetical protein